MKLMEPHELLNFTVPVPLKREWKLKSLEWIRRERINESSDLCTGFRPSGSCEPLVQFSRSVVSDSLQRHGLQHTRPPCPSPTLRAYSNSSCESVMPSNHLILCHPLLLWPSIFPSIRVFSNESVLCIRWPNYWSFRFNISPSNEYSGLISFRMDWFDFIAVQGTLKSLL